MKEIISNSEQETKNIAVNIAKQLKCGDIIVLSGDLGSGKTKFTEGILTYFEKQDEISSPTFTIVNEYYTSNLNIYHFDVYRLEDSEEFLAIGAEEYFDKGACIIEWGEMIEDILPLNYLKISFYRDYENENQRKLVFEEIGNVEFDI